MPIPGIYADESVNACMGVRGGRAKYGVVDSPAEGTVPSHWAAASLPSSGHRLSAGPTSPSFQGVQIHRESEYFTFTPFSH